MRFLIRLCLLWCVAPFLLGAEPERVVSSDPLFFVGETVDTATAQLLAIPQETPRLTSSDGTITYAVGDDFTWKPGTRVVTLAVGSRIAFKTDAQLYPAKDSPNSYRHRRGSEASMFFAPHGLMHQLQCHASYRTVDPWQCPLPSPASDAELGDLRTLLRAGAPIKMVTLGDSISTGADASASFKGAPHQPGYPDLVARDLTTRFRSPVTHVNLSVGGMDSKWGLTRVPEVIKEKPQLLLLAFGMNDASGRFPPAEFARVTKETMDAIRRDVPHCVVILVSSMTANHEWVHAAPELYPQYAEALDKLRGPRTACANVTAVWLATCERKKHMDLSGNGLNHPNDFGHRLYAETIAAVIGE
jgi:acyl-CoA thioesterase I